MHPFIRSIGLVGGLVAIGAPALAQAQNASEILAKVDKTIGGTTDQYLSWDMSTAEPGKEERRLSFEVTIKGAARLVEFVAPGDVKGTRVLMLSPSQMYIYLPAFKKVRRIASHMKEQGFMGSAWDHQEFSLSVFGEIFEAAGVEDHGAYWTLMLERREGQEFLYPRVQVDVRKDISQPVEIRYFNDKAEKVKTETRLSFACAQGFCTPSIVDMVDHSRSDIKTRMTRKDWKVNQGVPDSYFSVRTLQRGN